MPRGLGEQLAKRGLDLGSIRDLVVDRAEATPHLQCGTHGIEVSCDMISSESRQHNKACHVTFEHRLAPIKVGRVREVLAVEVQTLTELHEEPELLDQLLPAKVRLACLGKTMWKLSHRGQEVIHGDLDGRECGRPCECLGERVPREEGVGRENSSGCI
jgi:hypothetical protein